MPLAKIDKQTSGLHGRLQFLSLSTHEDDSDRMMERRSRPKILQIGNYPPPVCGWAMQTKLLVEEIRRRGNVCDVLNLNESHAKKSSEYVDVQNGFDYLYKLMRFASKGYRFQVHVNGQSKTGYILAFLAALVGRIVGRPIALSWRGGLQQRYFPRSEEFWLGWAYQLLFRLSGQISCNSLPVKQAIERYGIDPERVVAIPGFSAQHLDFQIMPLIQESEVFLKAHHPVFFCYVSFRPEYRLPVLREAMFQFRKAYPQAGFIWLGFPSKELPAAKEFVDNWPADERSSLLLLGNLTHDEFLTLLTRSFAYIRTPTCDGVSASVLESLALGVPVVASANGHRPPHVITYREDDVTDLCAKLVDVTGRYRDLKQQTRLQEAEDNIARTVDWLLAESKWETRKTRREVVHAD
jgi:glycosyltransferase involved in cell wall biosynthesis